MENMYICMYKILPCIYRWVSRLANIPVNPRDGSNFIQYSIDLYKRIRSAAERFFGSKSFIHPFIQKDSDKLAVTVTYMASVNIACIMIHLRYGI